MRRQGHKGALPACQRCGNEGAEFCWLCHTFLCDECLSYDYEDHRMEAAKHGGKHKGNNHAS